MKNIYLYLSEIPDENLDYALVNPVSDYQVKLMEKLQAQLPDCSMCLIGNENHTYDDIEYKGEDQCGIFDTCIKIVAPDGATAEAIAEKLVPVREQYEELAFGISYDDQAVSHVELSILL